MAFTLYERQYLGLHGLLPPAFMTEEQQAYRIISKLRQQPDDLARYIQLDGLQVNFFKYFFIFETKGGGERSINLSKLYFCLIVLFQKKNAKIFKSVFF